MGPFPFALLTFESVQVIRPVEAFDRAVAEAGGNEGEDALEVAASFLNGGSRD